MYLRAHAQRFFRLMKFWGSPKGGVLTPRNPLDPPLHGALQSSDTTEESINVDYLFDFFPVHNPATSIDTPHANTILGQVTSYGEGEPTKREGGHLKFLPLRKGGAEKVVAMLKQGHTKFRGSFYAVA